MNETDQQIALAKLAGKRDVQLYDGRVCHRLAPLGGSANESEGLLVVAPDYLRDLNAIHALVLSALRGPDIIEFRSNEHLFEEQLDLIVEREQVPVWHFGAELYCEALLKTLSLWKG